MRNDKVFFIDAVEGLIVFQEEREDAWSQST